MAYRGNVFLERSSERTTSDQEFVRLFSPKILDRLSGSQFEGDVHIFRSPPGGGKTTLLRAFTPTALRAFWNARWSPEMNESYQRLRDLQLLDEQNGPQVLGVLLSCASGYADLPPSATNGHEGLFRALLNCRVVLRSLASLASHLRLSSVEQVGDVRLEYSEMGRELKSIPTVSSPTELSHWAEQRERSVYARLDSIVNTNPENMPSDVRFEGVLWFQSVRFIVNGQPIVPKRLLMIDDLHKLRRKQRSLLIEEFTEIRPTIPIWLSERSIALGEELLSPGSREGRDVHAYNLDELWNVTRGQQQFATAQNILDRRLEVQNTIPPAAFSQYLRAELHSEDVQVEIKKGIEKFRLDVQRYRTNPRYQEWLARAERYITDPNLDSLRELYVTRILLARDELKRQMTLELGPLQAEEFDARDSSQVQAAADIFINEELKIPYYFGIERLCLMATSNVEELLSLAAVLYDALEAKQVLRKPELLLSPQEQEKVLKEAAKRKREFIPKNHTEGTRAQRLLDAIGGYCHERTFLPNAPYAPGVTGVRLSEAELARLDSSGNGLMERAAVLRRVLAECVAENLLFTRASAASTSRDSGTVFYLNRALCAQYGLPLQMGGWQDVDIEDLVEWMEHGPGRRKLPGIR